MDKDDDLEYDLHNLHALDPHPVDSTAYSYVDGLWSVRRLSSATRVPLSVLAAVCVVTETKQRKL